MSSIIPQKSRKRKEQQRNGWFGDRDESNQDNDFIPAEIAAVVSREYAGQELRARTIEDSQPRWHHARQPEKCPAEKWAG